MRGEVRSVSMKGWVRRARFTIVVIYSRLERIPKYENEDINVTTVSKKVTWEMSKRLYRMNRYEC